MAKKNLTNGPMHTRRPGEVVVVATPAHGHHRVAVGDPAFRQAYTDNPSHVIEPGVPTILPGRLFTGRDAPGSQLVATGQLEIVDADQGVLPQMIELSNSTERSMALFDRPPTPPRAVVIEGLESKYDVERSAAESILNLVERAGWSEEDAARTVKDEYLAAFRRSDGSVTRQSWVQLSQRIIASQKGRP